VIDSPINVKWTFIQTSFGRRPITSLIPS